MIAISRGIYQAAADPKQMHDESGIAEDCLQKDQQKESWKGKIFS